MKSNLRIITIFGREFLYNESGQKTLSKLQRPETGRAWAWELTKDTKIKKSKLSKFIGRKTMKFVSFLSSYLNILKLWGFFGIFLSILVNFRPNLVHLHKLIFWKSDRLIIVIRTHWAIRKIQIWKCPFDEVHIYRFNQWTSPVTSLWIWAKTGRINL